MGSIQQEGKTIWQQQAELQEWHDREYKRAYPGSTFHTGRELVAKGERKWDDLTPEEQEHKETVAHMLNKMLFSMGINVSDNFSDDVE